DLCGLRRLERVVGEVERDVQAVRVVFDPDDVLVVAQLQGRARCLVQPRVAAAQADQALVQPVDRLVAAGKAGGAAGGELGPDGVVAAGPVLLDAGQRVFVAGVDAGGSAEHGQQDDRVGQVPGVGDLGGDAGDVVVADEGGRREGGEHGVVAAQRPVQ